MKTIIVFFKERCLKLCGCFKTTSYDKALDINIGDNILDVGCGGGQLIEDIAKSVGIAGKAIGIDPSSSQISSAKDLCSDLENTLFICCLANNIDLISRVLTL